MVTIKSKKEIELMKEACRITALVHKEIEKQIKPGISTYDLNQIAERVIKENGAIAAQKGYSSGIKGIPNYPAAICASINDEVIHGIPSKKTIIKDGDIVSIDLVVYKNGFNGDAARTYIVGSASKEVQRLIDVTKQAFFEGIKYAREFQGHGIGRQMHEDPGIPNYGKSGRGVRLEPGMTLAVEPMVIMGKPDILQLDDGWTIVTEDGSYSAHYENTILITEKEPEVLTLL